MLCLKKVYRDELLQLAILLSLLRVDRRSSLGYDYDMPAIGVGIDDIQGWEQSHALVRRDVQIHPKSLDSVLLNYEQQVFDDLNSLGRYNRINSLQDVTAYLLNIDGSNDNSETESTNGTHTLNRTVNETSRTSEGDTASGLDLSEIDIKLEPGESEFNQYSLNETLFGASELLLREEEDYQSETFLESLAVDPKVEPGVGDELTQEGRMPYVRTMSMEQRWQDLANLLSLPDPSHAYHHFHQHAAAGYPGGPSYPSDRSVLLHNATLAPPMGDINNSTPYQPLGGGSNLGNAVATSMNLTNSSEPMGGEQHGVNFKVENPHDMMYYPNASGEMNHTTDGFLSSILNDEDLQLMDMAMNEGMYTMRMLEGSNNASAGERATDSDSAVSSMGSERVPSLSSDTEWMETNSDSGHTPADHYATDYHGKLRWYDYSYPGRGHVNATEAGAVSRLPQPSVAQKKHHMYGKRYFQEQGAGSSSNSSMGVVPSPGVPSGVKFDFGPTPGEASPFPTMHHESTKPGPEMKYSCSVEFTRHLHSGVRPVDHHIVHNHTYHLPPDQTGAMQRPVARDKQKGRRSDEEPLTRDEKRARSLNVPIPVSEIINLPMDEFNERLSKYDLSESQLSLIRDIRRRGKNKVAAQNCRKRKLDQIMNLADEVKQMRDRKHRLVRDRDYLVTETQRMKNKYTQLYRHIFQALRDSEGNPYSPYEWSLQQSADGSVLLVPRSNASTSLVDPSEPRSKHHKDSPQDPSRKQQ